MKMLKPVCKAFVVLVLTIFGAATAVAAARSGDAGNLCNLRMFDPHHSVCVCNSEFCDTIPRLGSRKRSGFQLFTTSRANLGVAKTEGLWRRGRSAASMPLVSVGGGVARQTVIGFGGALTDSAALNAMRLPERARSRLLEAYFGVDGAQYSLCRVPIGGTDFSTRAYSYADFAGDVQLRKFALQPEDLHYKVPLLKRALGLRGGALRLLATAWTAPPWMKTNNGWASVGALKDEFYSTWADYHVKFFDAYAALGLRFWAVTPGNEPINGFIPGTKINGMGWTMANMSRWIGSHFGPRLRRSPHSHLKILVFDDNRITLPLFPQMFEYNDTAMQYADGAAVHWYEDFILPESFLNYLNYKKNNWFLLMTEASNGYLYIFGLEKAVELGSWARAEKFVNSIFNYMEKGYAGWMEWNMILDLEGGPNYLGNNVDASVIVNATSGEFFKQPSFYALAHFSKFIIPGSVRLQTTNYIPDGVRVLVFKRPDKFIAIIIFNSKDNVVTLNIESSQTNVANVNVEPHSINTVIF